MHGVCMAEGSASLQFLRVSATRPMAVWVERCLCARVKLKIPGALGWKVRERLDGDDQRL